MFCHANVLMTPCVQTSGAIIPAPPLTTRDLAGAPELITVNTEHRSTQCDQYSTVQYSTVQYSTGPHNVISNGEDGSGLQPQACPRPSDKQPQPKFVRS